MKPKREYIGYNAIVANYLQFVLYVVGLWVFLWVPDFFLWVPDSFANVFYCRIVANWLQ